MIADVLDRTDETGNTTLETSVKGWINRAQEDFCRDYLWPFLEASATITLTDGTREYDLPSDYWHGAFLYQTDSDCVLEYMGERRFRELEPDPTHESDPTRYGLWGGKIWFDPIPSTTDNEVYIHYYKQPTAMSADSDTGTVPSMWHEALVQYALAIAKEKDDENGVPYMNEYHRIRESARVFYSSKNTEPQTREPVQGPGYANPESRLSLPIVGV